MYEKLKKLMHSGFFLIKKILKIICQGGGGGGERYGQAKLRFHKSEIGGEERAVGTCKPERRGGRGLAEEFVHLLG